MRERNLSEFIPEVWGYKVSEDGVVTNYHGRIIPIQKSGNVVLSKQGGGICNVTIQQIVAKAFVENPEKYHYVEFIDGNKENRHYTNLRWVKVPAKNVVAGAELVKKRIEQGYSTKNICLETGLTPQYVNQLKRKMR